MTARNLTASARLVAAMLATAALVAAAAGSAGAATLYNDIPSPLPPNVGSLGFECCSASEFGGQVELAPAATHKLTGVTVGMSSWACQNGGAEDGTCGTAPNAKFTWPVTLKVYTVGAGNSVGTLLYQSTNVFSMPYRPSANNVKCASGESKGGWWSALTQTCNHGKLFKIRFGLSRLPVPDKVIISVSYNTSDYGAEPQRPKPCNTTGNCPYDSLNVGLEGVPTVGADPLPESAYFNTSYGPFYCDGGAGGVGVFRLDEGCWTGYQPLLAVTGS